MWGPSADEDVDLADIRDLVIWTAQKGEIPRAIDWLDGPEPASNEDPMGHMF
jgi:hypothetical protein